MLVSRLAGLVLPWSSRYISDEVVGQKRADLSASSLQQSASARHSGLTSFGLSQILGHSATRMPDTAQFGIEAVGLRCRGSATARTSQAGNDGRDADCCQR